jgi:uncharacterized membrane protein YbhN (UPF0104 family)
MSGAQTNEEQVPAELNPRRLRRRLLEFAAVGVLIGILILLGPGLGSLRSQLRHASAGWLVAAVALEVGSALSYVLIFRVVFCRRMSWKLSYQIGMAEQGANSVLSVSGAGGLALGAWALRRGGMSTEYIGRRTVAFFILTSLANVVTLVVFAALYALGLLGDDRSPGLTFGFGAAALVATAIVVLGLPRVSKSAPVPPGVRLGKIASARRFARDSLGQGVRDGLLLLREHPVGVLVGSFGTMGFDIAVLGLCFRALHYSPAVGVLVVGYLIGQLGGNIPIPGGILGLDGGLIGAFVLYGQPLATTTGAVLLYHAIALWVPGLLGTIAFVQLRRILQRESQAAAMCSPLAEPIEAVRLPATVGGEPS